MMDANEKLLATLEHVRDRLSLGAPVLLHDHAYRGYRPQELAMAEPAARLGTHLVSPPPGQGPLLRP